MIASQTLITPTPPNLLDNNRSPTEVYYNQLLRQNRGVPLHCPAPRDSLPQVYQERAVLIGDVGRITTEGFFDFFFNVYHPATHPINVNGVPEDFCPLEMYLPHHVTRKSFKPGEYVSSPSVYSSSGESNE